VSEPRVPGDARTSCFGPAYEPQQVAIEYGQKLAQAFSELYSNVGEIDNDVANLWRRADDAIADLLQELWKRTPDDRAELLAQAAQKTVDGRLKRGELRKALRVYRGEE
jgi:hypothetical protein